jgi:hypothetical protein
MGFFAAKKVKKAAPGSPSQNKAPPLPKRSHQHASTQTSPAPGQHWQQPFQPAGYLPAPPGWTPPAPHYDASYRPPPPPYQHPIVVNQHYYLPQPSAEDPNRHYLTKLTGSVANVAREVMPVTAAHLGDLHWAGNYGSGPSTWHGTGLGTQLLNQTAAVVDQISSRFDRIMTMIDVEKYTGNEPGLFTSHPAMPMHTAGHHLYHPNVEVPVPEKSKKAKTRAERENLHPKGQTTAIAVSVASGSYFDKVELYANSRLSRQLPPLKL